MIQLSGRRWLRTISPKPIFNLLFAIALAFSLTGCDFTEFRKFLIAKLSTTENTGNPDLPATEAQIDEFLELAGDTKGTEQALSNLPEMAKKLGVENDFKEWVSAPRLKKVLADQRDWDRKFYSSNFSNAEMQKLIEFYRSEEAKKLTLVHKNSAMTPRPVFEYISKFSEELRKFKASAQKK